MWQHLEHSLQYLQIEVLCKHGHLQSLQGQGGRERTWPSRCPDHTVFSAGLGQDNHSNVRPAGNGD